MRFSWAKIWNHDDLQRLHVAHTVLFFRPRLLYGIHRDTFVAGCQTQDVFIHRTRNLFAAEAFDEKERKKIAKKIYCNKLKTLLRWNYR